MCNQGVSERTQSWSIKHIIALGIMLYDMDQFTRQLDCVWMLAKVSLLRPSLHYVSICTFWGSSITAK